MQVWKYQPILAQEAVLPTKKPAQCAKELEVVDKLTEAMHASAYGLYNIICAF